MGAVDVCGSFSSSDWKHTIEILKNQERRYIRNESGEMEEDRDYAAYSGTILSVDSFDFMRMNSSTAEEIKKEIWKEDTDCNELVHFDKWEGIVIEGKQVGYDIYTPKFEKISNLPFDFRPYINKNKGDYVLLRRNRFGLKVIKCGNIDECKDEGSKELYYSPNEVLLICGLRGNHYRCLNNIKRVSDTTKDCKIGCLIKPVHNYYYGGIAGC